MYIERLRDLPDEQRRLVAAQVALAFMQNLGEDDEDDANNEEDE